MHKMQFMNSPQLFEKQTKNMKPKVLVFSGYGLNCEEETKFAFELAGATADIIHINDLIAKPKILDNYQVLAFPGGFSYGDDTGSGNAFANKLRNHVWDQLEKFVTGDKLVIGICNGFQIIADLGLLPALKRQYGKREIALLHNDSARYTVRWVDLQVENDSPWLSGMTQLPVAIAHGEGKLFADKDVLSVLKKEKLVALRYVNGEICKYQNLPYNPTGTLDDIAGITDETGKVLGLMPHPERAMFFTQLPNWPLLKEQYKREGKRLPKYGPGLQIFKNSVAYFK